MRSLHRLCQSSAVLRLVPEGRKSPYEVNIYAYARGNPISWIDRRGLCSDPAGDEARALAAAALEGGNTIAVDAALAGAKPFVSPTVIAEFAAGGGDVPALEAFLSARRWSTCGGIGRQRRGSSGPGGDDGTCPWRK